jgi:hypothetical protein
VSHYENLIPFGFKTKKVRTTSDDAGGKSMSETESKSTGGKCLSENSTGGKPGATRTSHNPETWCDTNTSK